MSHTQESTRSTYHKWHEIHYGALEIDEKKITGDIKHVNSLVKAARQNSTLEDEEISCCSKIKKCFQTPNSLDAQCNLDGSYGNNALMLLKLNKTKRETMEYKNCEQLLKKYGANEDQMTSMENSYSRQNSLVTLIPFYAHNSDDYMLNALKEYYNNNQNITDIYDGVTELDSSISLIQWCCKKGFESSIDFMIEKNVNIMNRTLLRNTKHPLLYLLRHYDLFKKYLNKDIFQPNDIPKEILAKAAKQVNSVQLIDTILTFLKEPNFKRIFQKIIHGKDDQGRTALHYAAMFSSEGSFFKLLESGCSLMETDNFGKTPLDLLYDPQLLTIHFNNCIEIKNQEEDHKSYELSINYESLMTKENIKTQSQTSLTDLEVGTSSTKIVNESFFLKSLLQKKFRTCFNHPVVGTYIYMKWRKLQKLFWFYFFLNLIACVCNYVGTAIFDPNDSVHKTVLLFTASLVILLCINIMEFLIFGRKSWKNLQFGMTGCLILSIIFNYLYFRFDPKSHNVLVTLSCTTFLTTYKIFLILQIHPKCAVKVMLLRRTLQNFFKVMCFYSLPLMAFSLCFYILNERKSKYFATSIFKTFLAFAGDIQDSTSDKYKSNPIFFRILVILFIFIAIITLNNLFSALAISDLNQIYSEASFIEKKEFTLYILMFEKMCIKNSFCGKLLCYVVSLKLFHNSDNFCIKIFPNRTRNFQIGYNRRKILGVTRPIKELLDFIRKEKISKNNEKSSIENKVLMKIVQLENKLDDFLNIVPTRKTCV